jgi:hypothetical protein
MIIGIGYRDITGQRMKGSPTTIRTEAISSGCPETTYRPGRLELEIVLILSGAISNL